MDNRRSLERHNLQVKTVLSFTDATSKEARTINISGDGAFIMTSNPQPVGSRVYMSLLADARPDDQIRKKTVIDLEGIVSRITPYGIGVCFKPYQCAHDKNQMTYTQLEYATEIFYAGQTE